ncbi:PhzF family phenazine biosynthesis protein [Rhodococcus ruber BKS 20-38]|uniref:PhzF family phenazine biosynthesis protein n=1 Tax=Rhodococcus ruber BKS 20-38 TaxID=1278076 RepID=M2XZA8_9NOCA|nr:PhzF family phenazine biosynthesis protein [Rhodococcus ruber]EME66211.1 PhzF family phenazine biosynthesis protein [Rhodococcus ruber BKS 20-38]
MVQPRSREFAQVDVFAAEPYRGNPVAVVLDGAGLPDEAMAQFAAWTNLSETTFVLPPTTAGADYRLRIFTPAAEIPFAGHPTLGSAHAWLEAGGGPNSPGLLVQECGAGLVALRRGDESLAFRAPEPVRRGDLDDEHLSRIARGLGIDRARIVAHNWVDNGPGWAAVLLGSAQEVLDLEPDDQHMRDLVLGVVGPYPPGSPHQFEVRAFAAPVGIREDPVTGSLNAGLAQWLIGAGLAPADYRARQGTRVGRHGILTVHSSGDEVWIGGSSTTCIRGTVHL